MPNHEKTRRSIRRELVLLALATMLLVGFGLVRMQPALAAIPGVTVTGRCAPAGGQNNFMDVTNNRTTSITIDVGGVDTDTSPPSGNPIGQHTFAPSEHFTFDIPTRFDNATASDHSKQSDHVFIKYDTLCGNTHPAAPPDNLHSFAWGPSETGPVCQDDGTWKVDYGFSIHWRAIGVPDNLIEPREVTITHFELSGLASGDHSDLWHPNPMPEQRDQFSLATVIVPGNQAGQLKADITFQPKGQPVEKSSSFVDLGTCSPTTTTTTVSTTTTTTLTTTGGTGSSPIQVSPPTVTPGQTVTVTGGGFAPNQPVQVTLSGGVIGSGTSDSAGNVSLTVTIPANTSLGEHPIVITGPAPGGGTHQAIGSVTVVAAAAPASAMRATPSFTG